LRLVAREFRSAMYALRKSDPERAERLRVERKRMRQRS
jgi:hypothetical protein